MISIHASFSFIVLFLFTLLLRVTSYYCSALFLPYYLLCAYWLFRRCLFNSRLNFFSYSTTIDDVVIFIFSVIVVVDFSLALLDAVADPRAVLLIVLSEHNRGSVVRRRVRVRIS